MKVIKNYSNQDVIEIDEDTVALLGSGSLVQINQLDGTGDRSAYDSIWLSKNTIIHLAAYFLAEGAEHDLSWEELGTMVHRLVEHGDKFSK